MRKILVMLVLLLALPAGAASAAIKYPDWQSCFAQQSGCAVFLNETTGEWSIHNQALAEKWVSPCSTFKIPAVLCGLKYGVVTNEQTLFKWDGQQRHFAVWNQDLTCQQAFDYSAVWYFERLAAKVGQENMRSELQTINYGNAKVCADSTFWLESSLKISAREQADLMYRIFTGRVPYTEAQLACLKRIMYRGKLADGVLYGKTGTGRNGNIGWFVGAYEHAGQWVYFAVHINEPGKSSGKVAREIAEKIILENY